MKIVLQLGVTTIQEVAALGRLRTMDLNYIHFDIWSMFEVHYILFGLSTYTEQKIQFKKSHKHTQWMVKEEKKKGTKIKPWPILLTLENYPRAPWV